MIVSKLLKLCSEIKNTSAAAVVYKICKMHLNLFYPVFPPKITQGIDSNSNIIISLTTYPARINTVWITITTLLNQTVKPKMVLLWLAKDQFPSKEALPKKLLDLEKHGLIIKFCEDLKPHKKYFFTLKEFPNADIITVDDDIFYPEDLVDLLVRESRKEPGVVCCLWGVEMVLDKNKTIAEYSKWKKCTGRINSPSLKLMPIGCGGVLYPANIFDGTDILNKKSIKKLCLNNDDLWLKSMCLINRREAVRVSKYNKINFSILSTQKYGLHYENAGQNKNDIAMKKIINEYPDIIRILSS